MSEYELIQNPSKNKIEQFARELLHFDPQNKHYFKPLFCLLNENMTTGPEQKLLLSKVDDKVQGFLKYSGFNPLVAEIHTASRIFSLGPITNLEGSYVQKKEILNYLPFSLYTGKGSLVFIDHIEIAQSRQRKGVGRKLLETLIDTESAELIEGLALPKSLFFWSKAGFVHSRLISRELTVIGWHKSFHQFLRK